jgi:hypothetical protein
MAELPDFLRGAVDLHVHSTPDVVPRRLDDMDLARESAAGGFSALLLKNDFVPTMDRAYLVNKIVPGITLYGGIVLNDSIGGFNVAAVQAALDLGARAVWMPTKSAHNHRLHHGGHGGLTVFDAHGELRHHVKDILIVLAHSNAMLATGHLSPEEGAAVIRYAYMQGVRRLVVTHPEWGPTRYPIDIQRDLARYGAMFERCYAPTSARAASAPVDAIANAVSDVGVDSTVLASDLGHPDGPSLIEGMSQFAAQLRAAGFTEDELHQMMVANPAHLLE